MKQVIAAKAQNVVTERQYNGMSFKFREDGYFNMTHAAKQFGKQLQHFWNASETEAYKDALALAVSSTSKLDDLKIVEVIHGNRYIADRGTWAHPKLAVFFARWLDVKFAVFCDMVIDDLMHGHSVLHVVAPEKAIAPKLPQTYLESLQELIESVKEQDRLKSLVQEKEAILVEQAPKVDIYDKFMDSGLNKLMRDVASELNIKRDSLSEYMAGAGWIYRKQNRTVWLTYAKARDAGFVKQKLTYDSYGQEREQVLITPKGVDNIMNNIWADAYKA